MRSRLLLFVVMVCVAAGAQRFGGPAFPEALGDLGAGLALVAAGLAAWRAPPGALMVLAGGAWFAGDLSAAMLYVHRGPLVQLLLAYPARRPRPFLVAALVALAYVDGAVADLARNDAATVVLFGAVIAAATWRYLSVGGAERRARAAALAACLPVAGTLVAVSIARLAGGDPGVASVWAFDLAVAFAATGLAADLRWGGWTRSAVTGLVVELGGRRDPQALRAALARMLADPGLQVAYRGNDGWLDESGAAVAAPSGADGRVVTFVEEDGEPVAALVHDPAALADPELAGSVAAVARVALANVRMQAEIAARVSEVSRSRLRLVEAGDQERHALRDELRSGSESRLESVARRLAALAESDTEPTLRQLAAECDEARDDLGRFAQGIYPQALSEHGLRAALTELTTRSPVTVELSVSECRFEQPVEAAAYFVCTEGLANVAKYARASRAAVCITRTARELVVRVDDEGVGGADPAHGSGLRGLADRVAALDGTLVVASEAGVGTRLEARLPLARPGSP